MTDRDESSEGFLGRWSRKKIGAEQETSDAPKPPDAAPSAPAGRVAENGAVAPKTAEPKPEFDLTSLPSLESITAGTDIRAFLSPGVPAEIARAALRRAWAADPVIRDFVGLAENAWDFTDPAAMPGFGPLEPGYDVRKLVAQVFGEVERLSGDDPAMDQPGGTQPSHLIKETAPPEPPAKPGLPAAGDAEASAPAIAADAPPAPRGDLVPGRNITASHNSNVRNAADDRKTRRNHGGALPQ